MAVEHGEWIMRGVAQDDPGRIRHWQELVAWIDEIGFLPLFQNKIPGFSVEEHTYGGAWWTGDPTEDPWEWRQLIARSGKVAYGKFFHQKAGFIARSWFPHFANWRRDGYDFDSRWDEELATRRQKRVMDLFTGTNEWLSCALKEQAGFQKGGEKNFEGTLTQLQMGGYLLIRDFQRKQNREGKPYGWPIAVYTTPEALWGYDIVTSAYPLAPDESKRRIFQQVQTHFPASDAALQAVLGWRGM